MPLSKKRHAPLIEILNLSKAYAGSGTLAVSDFNLSVPEGEFLVLTGARTMRFRMQTN